MRRAANIDSNQPEIVKALRQIGASVQHLHAVGQGCPDLLVGYRGVNVLLEVKDGAKFPSQRELNAAERDWHATWGGSVAIVETPEEAQLAVIAEAERAGRFSAHTPHDVEARREAPVSESGRSL